MNSTPRAGSKVVEIYPPVCLLFDDIPKKDSKSLVRLANIMPATVLFKIKTTAPKNYTIRPSQGSIPPNEAKDIIVTMNSTESYPSLQNLKDRFLIQAILIDNSMLPEEYDGVWKTKEIDPQKTVLEVRFKSGSTDQTPANLSGVIEKTPLERYNTTQINNFQAKIASAPRTNENIPLRKEADSFHQLSNSHTNLDNHGNSQQDSGKSFTTFSETDEMAFDFKKGFERLVRKVEEQEKRMHKVSEERDQVYKELTSLKGTIDQRKQPLNCNPSETAGGFQFLHVFIVAVISLLVGIFFSV